MWCVLPAAGLPPIDSVNLWGVLSGHNTTSPRTSVLVDKTTLITQKWKVMTGHQVCLQLALIGQINKMRSFAALRTELGGQDHNIQTPLLRAPLCLPCQQSASQLACSTSRRIQQVLPYRCQFARKRFSQSTWCYRTSGPGEEPANSSDGTAGRAAQTVEDHLGPQNARK